MSRTIAGTVTTTVTLTAAYDPLVVTSAGVISTAGTAAAIYGGASQGWQITNFGDIENVGQFGIELLSASTIGNAGLVTDSAANGEAVRINGGAGLVTNSQIISGGFDGVVLTAGGSVSNIAGNIVGARNDGVYISGGAGTVTNAGDVKGGQDAVQFVGSFADRVIIDPGAVFNGKVVGGSGSNTLELAASSAGVVGTLTGLGSNYTGFGTVTVDSSAAWQLDRTSTVAAGVALRVSGSLANAGLIGATVSVASGGSFANAGTVNPGSGTIGVSLVAGGVVSNSPAGAVIEGGRYGIRAGGAAASVTNGGTIIGTSSLNGGGVGLYAGGSVTNTGKIAGDGGAGIYICGGGGTIANGGTIAGVTDAVKFAGSFADRVILDAGAVFSGLVQGGTGTNALDLAAGSPGATGTLGSFTSSFANFHTITVDQAAAWQFASGNTFASSVTVHVSGTLKNAGVIDSAVKMAGGASLVNTGTVQDGCTIASGAGVVTNSGVIGNMTNFYGLIMSDGGTVTNSGQIYGNIASDGVLIEGGAGDVLNVNKIEAVNVGVVLTHGGSVLNTGVIASSASDGIDIKGGAGTVTNSGRISGYVGSQSSAYAIHFEGSYADRVIIDPGASFGRAVEGGSGTNTLELSGSGGSVSSAATLSSFASRYVNFGTIAVDSHADWHFDASDTIGSTVKLTDAGSLGNAGVIDTTVTAGSGASLGNSGTISAAGYGVYMQDGGTLTNTGQINGTGDGANGVHIEGGAGLVINSSGSISGGYFGVALRNGGTVVNKALITTNGNGYDGVYISGGPGTVINSGTIDGTPLGHAVQFGGAYADRVIFDAGAAFNGTVQGGAGSNTLELAAGSAGVTGTLSLHAGNFTNFGSIAVDAGAHWVVAAISTISAGTTLTDAGTLNNAGVIDATVTIGAPTSLTNSGTINGGSTQQGVAMLAGGTLVNAGLTEGTDGVSIAAGAGLVSNAGTIIGASYGIDSSAGGTLHNTGTIVSNSHGEAVKIAGGAGTVTNTGSIGGSFDGVVLTGGGTVQNSGAISGGGNFGVYISGGAGTLTNSGTVSGSANAVIFKGSFADRVILAAGAAFKGTVQGGSGTNTLELAAGQSGAIGTLSSFATAFAHFGTIAIDAGADWQIASSSTVGSGASITDAGTLANAGVLDSPVLITAGAPLSNSGTIINGNHTDGYGVYLLAGGRLTNTGLIEGYGGVSAQGSATITNSGSIISKGDSSIGVSSFNAASINNTGLISGYFALIDAAGQVTNSGTIAGGGYGVQMGHGGTITNIAGGRILATAAGGTNDQAVFITGGAGKVTNAGLMSGDATGLVLTDGGSVSNTGSIGGASSSGVSISGAGATVTNAGTISGGTYSVRFAGDFSDRLILDQGAALQGKVQGGTGSNTLELAAGSLSAAGTLANFGTEFSKFGQLDVDAGATWKLTAASSSAGSIGSAVDVGGTLSAAAGALTFLGTVTNQGTIGAPSTLVAFDTSVGGTGALQIGATGTLSLALGAGTGQTVDFLAGTGLLDLAAPTAFKGTITGFGASDRIDLLNTSETSYTYANNVLTVENGTTIVATLHFTGSSNSFSLTSDQHGGTFILFT